MPYEIIPHLWLGDAEDTMHLAADVQLVVNCTKNLPFYSPGTRQLRIAVDDSFDEDQQAVMYESWVNGGVLEAIDDQLQQGHDVMVHCQMGRQRSAATIAAFLMRMRGSSLQDAVALIKAKKRDAFFPAVNFLLALQHFEKQV